MNIPVIKSCLILLLLSAILSFPAFSQTPVTDTLMKEDTTVNKIPGVNVRKYTTQRLTTPKPVIDGKLNDECWKTGTLGR